MDSDVIYRDGNREWIQHFEGKKWESKNQSLTILSWKYLLDERVEISISSWKWKEGAPRKSYRFWKQRPPKCYLKSKTEIALSERVFKFDEY